MTPFAQPATFVPGATRRIDPDLLVQERDLKGRPLWDMPSPASYVEHTMRHRDKKTGKAVASKAMVPIYRGVSAKLANWYRGDARRNARLREAFAAARLAAEAENVEIAL